MSTNDRANLLLDSAVAFRDAGDFDRAILKFSEAIALEPERGDYNYLRAKAWLLKGGVEPQSSWRLP